MVVEQETGLKPTALCLKAEGLFPDHPSNVTTISWHSQTYTVRTRLS